MNGKLAVLIPAFNGGELLRRTIESCVNAGLDHSRYCVAVFDNCSTDGSLEGLGSEISLHRNERNLGRVGNWNRALEGAESLGATYASFLFVGDEWMPNGSIGALLDSMDRNRSVLGMAALRIVNQQGALVRPGARVTIKGKSAQVDSAHLLEHSIGSGRLPFAPIQANVYRLFPERPLRFSTLPDAALNSDIEATAHFLREHPGPVSIEADPYLLWRERRGRFFTAQDPWVVFTQTRRTLQRLSTSTGIPVDWRNANAVAMLASIRETSSTLPLRTRLAFQIRALRYLLKHESGLSVPRMAGFIAKKMLFGRNYLDLTSYLKPGTPGASGFQAVIE
jgi:hypothetical protein